MFEKRNLLKFSSYAISIGLIIVALILRPRYHQADFPYFQGNSIKELIVIFVTWVSLLAGYLSLRKVKLTLEIVIFFQALVQVAFVLLFPLTPFSDMRYLYEIAKHFALTPGDPFNPTYFLPVQFQYISSCPHQLGMIYLLAIWMKIGGTSLFFTKLLGILSSCLVTLFGYKIYRQVTGEENSFSMLLLAFFPAGILFANHIYNDMHFAALMSAYVYYSLQPSTKVGGTLLFGIVAGLAHILRPIAVLFVVPLIFFQIRKRWPIVLATVCVYLATSTSLSSVIQSTVELEKGDVLPPASYIYIGLNPNKIGFQDGTASAQRTLGDVVERIVGLGPRNLTLLLVKKCYWLWFEGTYQVERYAFGSGAEYESNNYFVTNVQTNQDFRNFLNTVMFAMNLFLVIGSILAFAHNYRREDIRAIFFIFVAFFFFFAIWEIKSRYVLPLYPLMITLTAVCLKNIFDNQRLGEAKID